MQNLSTLLKEIQIQRSELQTLAELITEMSGVSILEKDITLSLAKGFRKLRLKTSGPKRNMLALKKDSLQEKLSTFGVTLVL